jgi:uncharacterized BrkB/YihY/UPF0761 family membrane protein
MVWLYWTAFAVLLGGEINADLLHAAGKHIPVKEAEAPTEATSGISGERAA